MKISLQMAVTSLVGLVIFGLLLFLPVGTFDYWQAWVFVAVFVICTIVPSIYLLVTDPAALQRRMHGARRRRPGQSRRSSSRSHFCRWWR